jgi:predicted O-methyltransferase YrrM
VSAIPRNLEDFSCKERVMHFHQPLSVTITFAVALLMPPPSLSMAQEVSPPPILDAAPLPQDDVEKRILDVLDDLDRHQRQGMMNVPREDGRLLRLLTESLGAQRVVEIGASNGYSGIWIALALRKTGGRLITHEIDESRAALARQNFKRAGVESLITLVMGDAHETVTNLREPIDVLFIDADKPGYPDYLQKLLPLIRPGGLIIGHNMRRPAPDPQYIKAITTNPALDTLFLNMHAAGIAVTMKKR